MYSQQFRHTRSQIKVKIMASCLTRYYHKPLTGERNHIREVTLATRPAAVCICISPVIFFIWVNVKHWIYYSCQSRMWDSLYS